MTWDHDLSVGSPADQAHAAELDSYALRAALAHLLDMCEDTVNHPCTCGTPEGELTCPHCNQWAAARRFAEVAGALKGSDCDRLGEWILDGQEGWVYEPPAPF